MEPTNKQKKTYSTKIIGRNHLLPKRQNWLFNLEHKNSLALLDISKPHPRREEVEIQHFFWSKDKIWNLNHLKNIFVGNNTTKNFIGVLQEGDFPDQKIASNNQAALKDINDSLKGPADVHKIYGQNMEPKIGSIDL